ncbi:hypothetical protein [Aporhodopirellula aestuarii]|uniref:Secreted protein n=1 Tax=Aporhodopirellula aestuarii TaxID=2950107 RepID=A0ABT0UBA6_9BACT|nr:hypothetical protein [Aporhodopirellula aestuarii]MCM2374193.1 hypothetical protein [Aporhodopirellula aestuarii]
MRSSLLAALVALFSSAVCVGMTGCSDDGNRQIAPNPEAKVLTQEERDEYNEKQSAMMIPQD